MASVQQRSGGLDVEKGAVRRWDFMRAIGHASGGFCQNSPYTVGQQEMERYIKVIDEGTSRFTRQSVFGLRTAVMRMGVASPIDSAAGMRPRRGIHDSPSFSLGDIAPRRRER